MTQSLLGLAALAIALAYPFAGSAALAVPLAGRPQGAPSWLAAEETQILGSSPRNGNLIVRLTSNRTALVALARGWLLVPVPLTGCNTPRAQRT